MKTIPFIYVDSEQRIINGRCNLNETGVIYQEEIIFRTLSQT